jgi:hypothetical protein
MSSIQNNQLNRIGCAWSFQTLDPNQPDERKRAAVKCRACGLYYIASMIEGRGCLKCGSDSQFGALDLDGKVVKAVDSRPRYPISNAPGPIYSLDDKPLGCDAEPFDFGGSSRAMIKLRNNSKEPLVVESLAYPTWVSLVNSNGSTLSPGYVLGPREEQTVEALAHFLRGTERQESGAIHFVVDAAEKQSDSGGSTVHLRFSSGLNQSRMVTICWLAMILGSYFAFNAALVAIAKAEFGKESLLLSLPWLSCVIAAVITGFCLAAPELLRRGIMSLRPLNQLATLCRSIDQAICMGLSFPGNLALGLIAFSVLAVAWLLIFSAARLFFYLLGVQGSTLAAGVLTIVNLIMFGLVLQRFFEVFGFNLWQHLGTVADRIRFFASRFFNRVSSKSAL